jgi:uncharacterized coiled-coil DUF342 family protein
MKRGFIFIILGLILIVQVRAQEADTLRNSSVIKMAKAKLSDELIIDVIKSSVVDFDLSENSVKELLDQNVSGPVIAAMKTASGNSGTAGLNLFVKPDQKTVTPDELPKADPVSDPVQTKAVAVPVISEERGNEAYGYVTPVIDLITYHEGEIKDFSGSIAEWNRQLEDLAASEKRIREEVALTETELRDLKNSDSKGFSENILKLKKKLIEQRATLEKAKENIIKAGEKITSELEKISSESIKSAGNKYNDVSQSIKSYKSDPSAFGKGTPVKPVAQVINENIDPHFVPALEIIAWHKNKIKEAEDIIRQWDLKVREAVVSSGEIEEKMAPLKQKLEQYQADQKKFKNEIAAVKKQISSVEKEKKNLTDRIGDDSKELSAYYKQERTDIQKILDQRFADIIENINYAFNEN